jgi:hypothetical protein
MPPLKGEASGGAKNKAQNINNKYDLKTNTISLREENP